MEPLKPKLIEIKAIDNNFYRLCRLQNRGHFVFASMGYVSATVLGRHFTHCDQLTRLSR